MAFEHILYEKQREGVLITLNRPDQLNALNDAMRDELDRALDEAEGDPAVRAIVLTGAGRAFCAGADMGNNSGRGTAWPSGMPPGEEVGSFLDAKRERDIVGTRRLQHLWSLQKPVIGAINGWAMGWGSWIALCTHMTFASDRAVFAQPEVRQISNTNFIWTLLAGFKQALRYGLTGDHIDAKEALRIGLVNEVVPHDELLDHCFDLVERIAMISPETIKLNLLVATKGLEMMGLNNAWAMNAELSGMVHASIRQDYRKPLEDAGQQRGMRGYLEERDGPFQPEPFGPRANRPKDAQ